MKPLFTLGITTFNRKELAEEIVKHNIDNCGLERDEYRIIWLDDCSENKPDLSFLNAEYVIQNNINNGVPKSWNKIYRIFDTEWMVKLPHDCRLSDNWLKIIKEHIEAIPESDAFVIPLDLKKKMEEWKDKEIEINGKSVWDEKIIMGVFAAKRRLFDKVGYLDEEYGYYGFDDADLSFRRLYCKNIKSYFIKNINVEHCWGEDIPGYNEKKKEWIKKNHPLYVKNCEKVKNKERLFVDNHKI